MTDYHSKITRSGVTSETSSPMDLIAERVRSKVGWANTYTMHHPAELKWFSRLSDSELHLFAEKHGMNAVRHAGGIEFTHRAEVL